MGTKDEIDNAFYHDLKEDWYEREDHPVALLRAENKARLNWIIPTIEKRLGKSPLTILDMGCGGGFAANPLSKLGHEVHGIDLSEESLKVAQDHDVTKKVIYKKANILDVPYASHAFDVILALDVLEHVECPQKAIQEASRLLKPSGLFFFHTINRNPFSYLIALKGVEWFVKNTPKNLHLYRLFIRPSEMEKMCLSSNLSIDQWVGIKPRLDRTFFKMLITRKVASSFEFKKTQSLSICYGGMAMRGERREFIFKPISSKKSLAREY